MSSIGLELIADERQRQIDKEGWSACHDDGHDDGALAMAAACYAEHAANLSSGEIVAPPPPPENWPRDWSWRVSGDPVRSLVKAGALIAAEIDRLKRAEGRDQ